MRGIDEKELKKSYPNLHKELADSGGDQPEESDSHKRRKVKVDMGRGYDPSILDFLQRCSTDDEALAIIDFMEKKGDISRPYANSLRKKVADKGVRSFGPKRNPGHYEKVLR